MITFTDNVNFNFNIPQKGLSEHFKEKFHKSLLEDELDGFIRDLEIAWPNSENTFKKHPFIEVGKNNRIEICHKAAPSIFNHILQKYPDLIEKALEIRDAKNCLLFSHFSHFIEFLSVPMYQWWTTLEEDSEILELDMSSIETNLSKDLHSLKELCRTIDNPNLLDYVIALRAYEIPLSSLSTIDLSTHPKEVAFYHHIKQPASSKEFALILSASPESDHNGTLSVSPRLLKTEKEIEKIYHIRYRVLNNTDTIETVNQTILNNKDVKLVFIQGHGSPKKIRLTASLNLDETNIDSIPFDKLASDARIILKACSTGKGEHSLAQNIATAAKRIVFAPNAKSTAEITVYMENGSLGCKSTSRDFTMLRFATDNSNTAK